jgi:hypothetical protein
MPALRSSTGRGRRSLARSSAVPGVGAARTAKQTLLITLVTPEQRAASFAVGRVASNLGLGSGGTVAGFILASAQHLRSFQTLYLFDAITYAALALVVLAMVPNRRAAAAHAGAVERGFRAVARDRRFLIVIAVNIVLIIVGYTLSPVVIGGSGERRTLRTAARLAQHWNFVGGSPEEFARKRDVLYAHCHDIGRDPKEIMLSSHIRLGADGDAGPVTDTAAALGELGLDLAIVILPPPHDPAVLTPLADALTQLR